MILYGTTYDPCCAWVLGLDKPGVDEVHVHLRTITFDPLMIGAPRIKAAVFESLKTNIFQTLKIETTLLHYQARVSMRQVEDSKRRI